MKKFKLQAAAFAAVMLFTSLAFAEGEQLEEEKKPTKYLAPSWNFYPVAGDRINIDKDTYVFYLESEEKTAELNGEIMPVNATEKDLTYSSSNESIVTVTQDGVITVYDVPGTATIYISGGNDCNGNDLYRECAVEVRRAVTGVSLSAGDLSFYADKPTTARISANVYPPDATNKSVIWSSSDTSVAGVSADGEVSTCGVGTATITATTVDGGYKAQCIIRSSVYNITVKGLFITNAIEEMQAGGEYSLNAYIYPENARDKNVSWQSSNPEIADVSGGVLRAYGEGYTVITATASNGIEDYFTLKVSQPKTNDEDIVVSDDFEYTVTSRPVSERIAELSVPVRYTTYSSTFSSALNTQLKKSPVVFTTNSRAASQSEVEQYLNPSNAMNGANRYQFFDLSIVSNVSERMLNVYLSNKGILKGKGEVFRAAAQAYGINSAYLAVHACLESGGGTSELATGVKYNGATVYNMFGIGAYDDDPVNGGAKYAYDMGWFDVNSAIFGGAKWISENYINAGQNTLYKMRWNPSKPGEHQYATDIAWAAKQAQTLRTFMEVFPINELVFDVPVYSASNEPKMKYE